MSLKVVLFCAQALLIQSISCQCIGPYNGLAYDGLPYGAPVGPLGPGFAPANGGSFAVSSTSPIAPNGITVFSENAIEGTVSVGGVLPFLGTVALEAVLPTAGSGAVAYGCGNGAVGITAEDYGLPAGPGYPGYGPYGYGPCGGIY
ncbi:chorion class CB protein M5H4-like [Epargyreus clarus]|uniref:chorion class CB protein M5H4-like n=1 Tax=Epargyreus clarus TaxID=520877 RepID=UPI003C2B90DA